MSDHESQAVHPPAGRHSGRLPISPSLEAAGLKPALPPPRRRAPQRILALVFWAFLLGIGAGFVAQILKALIGLITNLAFYGRWSFSFASPESHRLGAAVIFIPIVGGLLVGLMARFGSKGIRGHGIPEAMEQVLTNQSRVPLKLAWLKPLSAAISIGTGGPFGAEGPIIATGGALGSALGQCLHISAGERKTLLACGAAAGMAATFGSPVAAVLLAIELLLFEFRAVSMVPVALASATAAGMRVLFEGVEPAFAMDAVLRPAGSTLAIYIALGGVMGLFAVAVTRAVYAIEDAFERLPLHWMWWPAIGAVAVGVIGWFDPRTLGVGYAHIGDILSNRIAWTSLISLCVLKFVSWCVSLGSGTSGGTLAPLFIVGGALGALLGDSILYLFPGAGVDVHIAALVGMAAIFAGASRAMLTSAVFAFETTLQPLGLLPLLGACAAAWLVASLLMRESIMTEKIFRRGVRVPTEFHADPLEQMLVRDVFTPAPVCLQGSQRVRETVAWMRRGGADADHQGFPILDEDGHLLGVLTRRDLLNSDNAADMAVADLLRRPPVAVYDDCTVREAIGHMLAHDVGRLPVIARLTGIEVIGILTRSDILSAYRRRLDEERRGEPTWRVRLGGSA